MISSQEHYEMNSTYDHFDSECHFFHSDAVETISAQNQDIVKKQARKSLNPTEAKNIPKNMGVLIKNYFTSRQSKIIRQNQVVSKFVKKAVEKKNYTRHDLMVLFKDEKARAICQEYLSSFQVIEDILKSDKIQDSALHLRYVKKLFIATYDPDTLSTLKYPQYQQ